MQSLALREKSDEARGAAASAPAFFALGSYPLAWDEDVLHQGALTACVCFVLLLARLTRRSAVARRSPTHAPRGGG